MGTRWIRLGVAVALSCCGMVLAMPQAVAFLRFERAWGAVRETFVSTAPDGMARLSVVYEFEVVRPPGRAAPASTGSPASASTASTTAPGGASASGATASLGLPDGGGDAARRYTVVGWEQGGSDYRRIADPVLPPVQARARAAELRTLAQRRLFRVHYRANDPEGTAFILIDDRRAWLHWLGVLLLLCAIAVCAPAAGSRPVTARRARRSPP